MSLASNQQYPKLEQARSVFQAEAAVAETKTEMRLAQVGCIMAQALMDIHNEESHVTADAWEDEAARLIENL